jgi:hypothetical protein
MNKMNDRLQRVQIDREKDVPIFDCWYLFFKDDGSWDSDTPCTDEFVKTMRDDKTKLVFAVWHGTHRTNLFLMDRKKLLKRFEKDGNPKLWSFI